MNTIVSVSAGTSRASTPSLTVVPTACALPRDGRQWRQGTPFTDLQGTHVLAFGATVITGVELVRSTGGVRLRPVAAATATPAVMGTPTPAYAPNQLRTTMSVTPISTKDAFPGIRGISPPV